MKDTETRRICLFPQLVGVGGMVSFQDKMAKALQERGIDVSYRLDEAPFDAVLVIGGTRQLRRLYQLRRQGIPIIQRLDGMNWLHRMSLRGGRGGNLRHYLRAEYGNWILRLIRSRLADRIVYQSEFAKNWWEREHGPTPVPHSVIYNAVDLGAYSPYGLHQRPAGYDRVLLVEGSLMGGYEIGLESALKLVEGIAMKSGFNHASRVELMVAGRVSPDVRAHWDQWCKNSHAAESISLNWAGLVPHETIPELDRSAHLLYSADINAACPNSVIEALACGLPVVAFDTGALPELVQGDSGRIVPYGGDAWKLDPPNLDGLILAAQEMLADQDHYRRAARDRAEAVFGLDKMVEGYLEMLLQ